MSCLQQSLRAPQSWNIYAWVTEAVLLQDICIMIHKHTYGKLNAGRPFG